jgi:DNA methyltransferase 1-associated protein 1
MAATDRRTSTAPVRSFKRARVSRPPSHWDLTSTGNRPDLPLLKHWQKASTEAPSFAKYNVEPEVPVFDDTQYEEHLKDPNWTLEETRYLVDTYKECNGKWTVVVDRYNKPERTMEDLKARYYTISATMLQLETPIQSMTAPQYKLYETLKDFNPKHEMSRKRLAEGHLQRRKDEVDEEAVLLAELQRIMANQESLDGLREDLRRRLDYPKANTNSYQYSTSQALHTLWQQLVNADRLRKNQRLRVAPGQSATSIETPATGQTPASGRPRESNAGTHDPSPSTANVNSSSNAANTTKLSAKDKLRYGVTEIGPGEKLPSGVSFASDKLSKPRIAKSTVQTEKIAAILAHIGVPELIPLPTAPVIEAFDSLMSKLHVLLDMRKVAEKEEQELRVREAEAAAQAKGE